MHLAMKTTLALLSAAALSGCASVPEPDYAAARQGVASTFSAAGSLVRGAFSSPMPAWGENSASTTRAAPPIVDLSTGGARRQPPVTQRTPLPKPEPKEEVQTFPVLPAPPADSGMPTANGGIPSADGSATLVVLPNGELGPSKLKK